MPRDGRSFTHDPVFDRLERQMDQLVERLLRRPSPAHYQRAWAPRLDVFETANEFVIVVELAGVESNAVTIEIEREHVSITGRRDPAMCPKGADILQLEIPNGEFERRLVLPSAVDAKGSTAGFNDGMLTVRLPKASHE
jgi:HSP20 family protein